jgi:hypothetical protein
VTFVRYQKQAKTPVGDIFCIKKALLQAFSSVIALCIAGVRRARKRIMTARAGGGRFGMTGIKRGAD